LKASLLATYPAEAPDYVPLGRGCHSSEASAAWPPPQTTAPGLHILSSPNFSVQSELSIDGRSYCLSFIIQSMRAFMGSPSNPRDPKASARTAYASAKGCDFFAFPKDSQLVSSRFRAVQGARFTERGVKPGS